MSSMTAADPSPLPPHYASALRTLVRFACAMTIVGLLAGVLFQESSKKLGDAHELHLQATLRLALLHGHVLVSAVLIPLGMAGALLVARRIGGRELGSKPLAWLTRGYLPLLCVTLALMLWKGYHVLLAVRRGEADLEAIDERFFFGATVLRHGVYGVAHVGMAAALGVFVVAVWRSLGAGRAAR
jgi:hypothetical protein